jgi:hypothetical protein
VPLGNVSGKLLLAAQYEIGFVTAIDGRIDRIVDTPRPQPIYGYIVTDNRDGDHLSATPDRRGRRQPRYWPSALGMDHDAGG